MTPAGDRLAEAIEREGHVARDRPGHRELVLVRGVRPREVQHELAEQVVAELQRDEGERGNAFGLEQLGEPDERGIGRHVGDHHRKGVHRARGPRGVPLDTFAVALGELARGHEAHHPGLVEEQHGRAVDAERVLQAIHGRLVDLRGRGGARHPFHQRP